MTTLLLCVGDELREVVLPNSDHVGKEVKYLSHRSNQPRSATIVQLAEKGWFLSRHRNLEEVFYRPFDEVFLG